MLTLVWSSRFKKDYKTCKRRHYDMELLKEVAGILQVPELLPEKYKDHPLRGNYAEFRECHLAPDWVLVYRQTEGELFLYRTGSHADLFG